MKIKVYIAGKISGDPKYKEKFEKVQQQCETEGCVVLNPAVLPEGMTATDYMRICFAMIDTADIVVFLDDYRQSAGAQLEMQYCLYTDKAIRMAGAVVS